MGIGAPRNSIFRRAAERLLPRVLTGGRLESKSKIETRRNLDAEEEGAAKRVHSSICVVSLCLGVCEISRHRAEMDSAGVAAPKRRS